MRASLLRFKSATHVVSKTELQTNFRLLSSFCFHLIQQPGIYAFRRSDKGLVKKVADYDEQYTNRLLRGKTQQRRKVLFLVYYRILPQLQLTTTPTPNDDADDDDDDDDNASNDDDDNDNSDGDDNEWFSSTATTAAAAPPKTTATTTPALTKSTTTTSSIRPPMIQHTPIPQTRASTVTPLSDTTIDSVITQPTKTSYRFTLLLRSYASKVARGIATPVPSTRRFSFSCRSTHYNARTMQCFVTSFTTTTTIDSYRS